MVTAVVVSLLSVDHVLAVGGEGFGLRPAHTDTEDGVLGYFKRALPPGGSFSDQVLVTNDAEAAVDLLVYPVDGLTGATSGSVYTGHEDRVARAGEWVTTATNKLTVAAHSDKLVALAVHIPPDTTPGDHLAGVAFENAKPLEAQGQFGVRRVVREVMGVLVTVTGPARPFELRISKLDIHPATAQGNTFAVTVELANSGQLLGKPILEVTMDGPGGYHRSLQRQLDTILPGDVITYTLAWPDPLLPGMHHSCASAGQSSVGLRANCADLSVEPPRRVSADPRRALLAGPTVTWSWIMLALFLAGLVIGGAIVALTGRRRSRNRKGKARP
jgi:hypothetical protein